jgi:signal transduction histidine kinase
VSHPDAWTAVRGRPWRFLGSAWPWRSLLYAVTTVPLGLAALLVLSVTVVLGLVTAVVVVGLLVLAGVPLLARVIAAQERRRVAWVLPREGGPGVPLRDQLRAARGLPVAWSEVGLAVLLATVFWIVDAVVLVFAVATPVVLVLAPVLVRQDTIGMFGWQIDTTGEAWFGVALGAPALAGAAYVVTALGCGQAALTRLLLDPPEQRLVAAVAELRRSRSGLVDAFEAERRRIERDLHDGVQQRLVALTMTLGSAEVEARDGTDLALLRRAHRQAEEALEELRRTVRGIHPRVLTDHGLAAAVHEIADRSPVPVTVDLAALAGTPLPSPVENAAYFVVSEALTNVARHAAARHAWVRGWVHEGRLVLTVGDDGAGGAVASPDSGLTGLALRLEALDGSLGVTSPAGGPTEVRMECPLT